MACALSNRHVSFHAAFFVFFCFLFYFFFYHTIACHFFLVCSWKKQHAKYSSRTNEVSFVSFSFHSFMKLPVRDRSLIYFLILFHPFMILCFLKRGIFSVCLCFLQEMCTLISQLFYFRGGRYLSFEIFLLRAPAECKLCWQ